MLANLLQDEISALGELQELLLQEFAALKARDSAALQRTADGKRACTSRLQVLASQRKEYLCGQDMAAVNAHIEKAQPMERQRLRALQATWEQAAIQARRQNEINGRIIAVSRSHVERALTILRGSDPRECLYDQHAHTSFGGHRRSLARA